MSAVFCKTTLDVLELNYKGDGLIFLLHLLSLLLAIFLGKLTLEKSKSMIGGIVTGVIIEIVGAYCIYIIRLNILENCKFI